MKDYYKILRVPKLAGQEEIKRSYRRLASRYHPDVNPSPDAHYVFVEINEAYEVLSDPSQKWSYDQRFAQPESYTSSPVFTEPATHHDKRKRRGKKETAEERTAKRLYAIRRNKSFNRKMKLLSWVSLFFTLSIFVDHYLPTNDFIDLAYFSFDTEMAYRQRDAAYSIMTTERPISLYVTGRGEVIEELGEGVGLFSETQIWGILASVQLNQVLFEPENSLYQLMLIYGLISLASVTVLFYKLEHDLFYPTFITFFSLIFVMAFMILKITS